eukprot:3337435-Rhodomonas_salina.1
MDNVYMVCQLEAMLAASSELADCMWQDLDLEVNTLESWLHTPAWASLGAAPDTLCYALQSFDNLCYLPLKQAGVKVDKAIELLEPVLHVEDWLLHFQLVRFCIQSKFTYLACCVAPAVTLAAALRLDHTSVHAIGDYAKWPHALERDQPTAYTMASIILALPNKQGGWGMTLHAGTCGPAYYASYASFLRWVVTKVRGELAAPSAQFSVDTDLQTSTYGPIRSFIKLHDQIIALGAVLVVQPPLAPAGTL